MIAQQEWAQLGVKVSVIKDDQGSLFTDYSEGKYQAAIPMPLITSDVLVPDELALAWLVWTPGQQSFFTQYKNRALSADVALANRTTNQAKRGCAVEEDPGGEHAGRALGAPVLRACAHGAAQQRPGLQDARVGVVGSRRRVVEVGRMSRPADRIAGELQ